MREIKFRAWDNNQKKMVLANDICRIHFDKGLPYGVLKWDGNILIHGEVILMQYTGLKDKNGKEIWEGDILEYTRDDNSAATGQKSNHGVVFDHGAFSMLVDIVLKGLCPSYLAQYNSYCEVIGNIYENPELIK